MPGFVDPGKPGPGDVEFRKDVWGDQLRAGRPPTVIGDLYYDFGFVGVAIGAVVVGVLMRGLLGLVDGPAEGRRYRVGLYALLMVLLYQLVVGTYSIVLGSFIVLVIPYLLAVHVFQRVSRPGRRTRVRRTFRRARAEA